MSAYCHSIMSSPKESPSITKSGTRKVADHVGVLKVPESLKNQHISSLIGVE